jgi:hypothetical protein
LPALPLLLLLLLEELERAFPFDSPPLPGGGFFFAEPGRRPERDREKIQKPAPVLSGAH